MNRERPLTDAFGTRLDPDELVGGLQAQGLADVRLVVDDAGFLVRHAGSDELPAMKALTWLRSVLSPLVPARLESTPPDPQAARFSDLRTHLPTLVTIGEAWGPEAFAGVLDDVLSRLQATPTNAGGSLSVPDAGADWAQMAAPVAGVISERLVAHGFDASQATLSLLVETRDGPRAVAGAQQGTGPHFLALQRRGGPSGVRPALIVMASSERQALDSIVRALEEDPSTPPPDVLLDGLAWSAGRRPTIAVPSEKGPRAKFQILVDPDRCTDCGLCAQVCPTDYLGASGVPVEDDPAGCIRCYDCVEACPEDALRPVAGADTATLGATFADRPGWLSRLRGVQGPPTPSLFPPSYLLPKPEKKPEDEPTWVLGLAVATMQEHAAALVKDGVVVGAVEEERLVRKRHYGWAPEGRPGVTICMDPRLGIEETMARRSVRGLLENEGLTLDDIDVIALNGIPARWRRTYSIVDDSRPLQPVKAGRVVAIPHHLAHAASAFRSSGFDSAWVFTVDGRGDRETASLARSETSTGLACAYTEARDASTALGAALEAWAQLGRTPAAPMRPSYLAPEFSGDDAEAVLKSSGYAYRRVDALEALVAARETPIREDSELARLPGGRRLLLRLTVRADTHEPFNTLRDMEGHEDRSFDEAVRSLAQGREARCDELVILRGEAAGRSDLPRLVERARRMGYRFVQLQTSGRPLANPSTRQALLKAGVDAFEVTLLASDEATHDRLAGAAGAFRETTTAIQALAKEGRDVLVLVPVVRANALQLKRVAAVVHRLGARRIQFNFPRPVELKSGVPTASLLRLEAAGAYVRHAAQTAGKLGLTVTTEGFPFCHLEPLLQESPDASEDFGRHRVDDLHLLHETLSQVRREARPEPPPCRSCRARDRCPKTWALYQELFGTSELRPLR